MNEKNQLEILQRANEAMQLMQSEIHRLSLELNGQKAELETWRRVVQSDDEFDMSEIAKTINYKGYGRNKLFEFLRDVCVLRSNNQPYQKFVNEGYFRIIEEIFTDNAGNERIYLKTVVKQKGIDLVRRLLDESNAEQN